MRLNRALALGVGTSLVWVTLGSANPILLASYDQHLEGGGASDNPTTTPWEISFILQLSPPAWEPYPLLRALDAGVFWKEGQVGTIWYTVENSDQFYDFASHATNGIEDDFMIWALDHDGGGTGLRRSEREVIDGDPDLRGNLEAVSLTVFAIHFEPYSPLPGLEGYRYEAQLNWSFYGTPVPEPSTLLMMWPPALLAGCAAKRRNRS